MLSLCCGSGSSPAAPCTAPVIGEWPANASVLVPWDDVGEELILRTVYCCGDYASERAASVAAGGGGRIKRSLSDAASSLMQSANS